MPAIMASGMVIKRSLPDKPKRRDAVGRRPSLPGWLSVVADTVPPLLSGPEDAVRPPGRSNYRSLMCDLMCGWADRHPPPQKPRGISIIGPHCALSKKAARDT